MSDTPFSGIGISPEVGSVLYPTLGIEPHNISAQDFSRLKEIASFLSETDDPLFFISRVKNNKSPNMSNVEFMLGMARLMTDRAIFEKRLKQMKESGMDFKKDYDEVLKKLENTQKDLKFYLN